MSGKLLARSIVLLILLLCFPFAVIADDSNSELLEATTKQDSVAVKRLLQLKDTDVNYRDKDGRTALIIAALTGEGNIVNMLLDSGADVNARDNNGLTALTAASRYVDIAARLLEKGADINAKDNEGNTPLMEATAWNRRDMAALLLKKGADAQAKNNAGQTALILSTHHWPGGDLELVRLLLNSGEDVNYKDNDGFSPLLGASMWGYDDIAGFLIKAGGKVDSRDKRGETPLMKAAFNGYDSTVLLLLEKGADVNARSESGSTALIESQFFCDSNIIRHANIVSHLLKFGASVNMTNTDGSTALIFAAMNGCKNTVKLMINAGADLDMQDNKGRTALMCAAVRGHTDTVRLLLVAGANISLKNEEGKTVTAMVEEQGKTDMVSVLKESRPKEDNKVIDSATLSPDSDDQTLIYNAEQLSLSKPDPFDNVKGVLVLKINAGSQAEKKGLRRGDIIIRYAGKRIDNDIDLIHAIEAKPVIDLLESAAERDGDSINTDVDLWYIRDGKRNSLKIKSGEIGIAYTEAVFKKTFREALSEIYEEYLIYVRSGLNRLEKIQYLVGKFPVESYDLWKKLDSNKQKTIKEIFLQAFLQAAAEKEIDSLIKQASEIYKELKEDKKHKISQIYFKIKLKLNEAFKLSRAWGKKAESIDFLSRIALCNYLTGNIPEAIDNLEEVLKYHWESGTWHKAGTEALMLITIVSTQSNGTYDFSHIRETMEASIKTTLLEGPLLNDLCLYYLNSGQIERGLQCAESSLSFHREIPNLEWIGLSEYGMGKASLIVGKPENALEHFSNALNIFTQRGAIEWQVRTLLEIGQSHVALDHPDLALAHLKQALRLTRGSGANRDKGLCLIAIGNVYVVSGEYEKALDAFSEANAIFKGLVPDEPEVKLVIHGRNLFSRPINRVEPALIYQGIGNAYLGMGDLLNANSQLWKALFILETDVPLENYDLYRGPFDNAWPIIYEIGKRIQPVYQQYGNKVPPDMRGAHLYDIVKAILAEVTAKNEQTEIATEQLQMLRSMIDERKASSHSDAGELPKFPGEPEFTKTFKFPAISYDIIKSLARTSDRTGDYKGAVYWYEQAIEIIESLRSDISESELRISFYSNKLNTFDNFIELLYRLHNLYPAEGYDRKALDIFERKQSRVFLEQVGKSGARYFKGIPDELNEKQSQLESKIGRLSMLQKINPDSFLMIQQQLEAANTEKYALEKTIRDKYPDYYALKHPQPVSIKELQDSILKPDEIMLIYDVSKNTTFLWVVGKNHLSLHHIAIGSEDLLKKIELYRKDVLDLTGSSPQSHDLYDLLIPSEVNRVISASDSPALFIVPTGPLYLLPFEALRTGAKARYLVEDHPISYLSSASLLQILRNSQTRRKQTATKPLLAFANPVYSKAPGPERGPIGELRNKAYRSLMGGEFVSLPETEDEVNAIKNVLQALDTTHPLYLKQEASRSSVMKLNQADALTDYRYLVFSCHSILPGEIDRVTQPALVLSDPDPETGGEGFLTMTDVFGLKLNADLVALSACNTGRGKNVEGEGVMGLTRAFMYAGTPSVLVTLWSVEVMSAMQLNIGLFRNLKTGRLKAQSLRDIKLRMIRGEEGSDWQHPFYWAPMVLFGDGSK